MLNFDQLYKLGLEARSLSYSPYSHFAVGAVIECRDGKVFKGANIENAAFGLTMCAERNAIFQAYLNGYRNDDFLQLLIVADSEEITSPCGSCRQVLRELFSLDAPIYCCNLQKKYIITNVKELLPYSFSKENIEK